MIKLVGNMLSDWKVLKDEDNNTIKWQYVVQLLELQESLGSHLTKKL